MADTELNIILKLLDNASADIKKAMDNVKGSAEGVTSETKKLGEESKKTGKTMQDQFKEAGKELRSFHKAMFALAASIAFIITTTKEWANSNSYTRDAYRDLGKQVRELVGLIGSLFAPTISALRDLFDAILPVARNFFSALQDGWTNLFKGISFGIQYLVAFVAAFSKTKDLAESNAIAMGIAGQAAEEMGEKFKKNFNVDINVSMGKGLDQLAQLKDELMNWMGSKETKTQMIDVTQETASIQMMLTSYQDYYTTTAQLAELTNNKILQANLKRTAQEKQSLSDMTKQLTMTTRQQIDVVIAGMNEVSSALQGAAAISKGWAKVAAAVALGMTIVNTAQGIMLAFATNPWPLSMVIAGLVAATGAIQIATIASQKFHEGGLVGGFGREVDATLLGGEGVLSHRGMAALGGVGNLNRLNSGDSITNNNTGMTVMIERADFRDDAGVEDVFTTLSRMIEQRRRARI
jgi:hypothetical protein